MAAPKVRVNTFFKQNQKPVRDTLSKVYIVTASILGLNRLPVILNEGRFIITTLAFMQTILLVAGVGYYSYVFGDFDLFGVRVVFTEYMFSVIFSFIIWKRMDRYYNKLNTFDAETGCRPKTNSQSIKNIIALWVSIVSFVTINWSFLYYNEEIKPGGNYNIQMMPSNFLHCLELYYYGHLLSLLVPRLRLINYFVESALSNGKSAKCPNIDELTSGKIDKMKNTDMMKLMDLYHLMIKAYDFLLDAIKWQLLVIIITTFISTLICCYQVSFLLMRKENPAGLAVKYINFMAMGMVPLFSPCMFGDRVHGEVRRLRELLASRLYENKLDKKGRSAARALLALTEARDLSFSLLHMVQIDISLPFKFIGLLVTYLIILLQFEKVINPSTATQGAVVTSTLSP